MTRRSLTMAPWTAAACTLLLLAAAAPASEAPAARALPHWQAPATFSMDLEMHAKDATVVMKRFVDGGRVRTEIQAQGQEMVLIELGDEAGTTYTMVPSQKMAIKRSAALDPVPAEGAEPVAEPTVELLGRETLGTVTADKYRIRSEEGSVLAWFDAKSGRPLRFEGTVDGQQAEMEWRNLKPGPQPDRLFTIPKGYQVQDMDEVMARMREMGGMEGMGGRGSRGIPGLGGMGQRMAGRMGSQLGGGLGAGLGASFGGPMGAVAGRYLGGRVGGWLGAKAEDTPAQGD